YESPPLLQSLDVINRESHNFFAESVFKTLGRVAGGEGTFDGGRQVVGSFLNSFAGVPGTQVSQRDGSGLSPSNQASARSFVQLLEATYGSAQKEDFLGTLPVAGKRRELGRMYQTPAAGNLRAKTGTIERVSALSGYVTSADGEPIAFSLISNGIRSRSVAKRLEDRLGTALSAYRRN
ncbi:MAG: D-alanyl-D-alanine carboxypeptidase/D-alanyl-D-alanine endopeptidase, partial [Longimicrobiales bacterium]